MSRLDAIKVALLSLSTVTFLAGCGLWLASALS